MAVLFSPPNPLATTFLSLSHPWLPPKGVSHVSLFLTRTDAIAFGGRLPKRWERKKETRCVYILFIFIVTRFHSIPFFVQNINVSCLPDTLPIAERIVTVAEHGYDLDVKLFQRAVFLSPRRFFHPPPPIFISFTYRNKKLVSTTLFLRLTTHISSWRKFLRPS